jgi:hypothetical protein
VAQLEGSALCCSPAARTGCCEPSQPRIVADPPPLASCCGLGEAELRLQLGRYRATGRGATVLAATPRMVAVRLEPGVDAEIVEAMLATERECCPFFRLSWEPDSGRLTIGIDDSAHEPALAAICAALGVGVPGRPPAR